MLTRAFTKPKRSFKDLSEFSRSTSISEYDEFIVVGFMEDLALIPCENNGPQLTLKEVLRTSVGVIGENNWGVTEKVVLSKGRVLAIKRFRKTIVRKNEFGRRIERLARISKKSEYLVPITAYLYSKRIKLVLCDYYPMGSLADLLAGGRRGQTALNWNERLKITVCVARAIAFIHAQSPPIEKNMKMNVHGNIKSSNVMINIDLTACLSDYGFVQLADCQPEESDYNDPRRTSNYSENLDQKNDVHDFGLVLLDVLGLDGVKEQEDMKQGKCNSMFEFDVKGKERKQALEVSDIAWACTRSLPEARPSMSQILLNLSDILNGSAK